MVRTFPLIALAATLLVAGATPASAVDPDQFVAPPGFNGKIQPGDKLNTPGGSCTLNFVFDGRDHLDGKVYIGTAAHCFGDVGEQAWAEKQVIGAVVYMGDHGPALNSPRYDNTCAGEQLDFALIEIPEGLHGKVDAQVKGANRWPVAATWHGDTQTGDLVAFSGYGTGWSPTIPTQEQRRGLLGADDARTWRAYATATPGDSGGPVIHVESGRALGIVSTLGVGLSGTNAGPTVAGALADAEACGFPVTLRTV